MWHSTTLEDTCALLHAGVIGILPETSLAPVAALAAPRRVVLNRIQGRQPSWPNDFLPQAHELNNFVLFIRFRNDM
jgi:hypothetical protein